MIYRICSHWYTPHWWTHDKTIYPYIYIHIYIYINTHTYIWHIHMTYTYDIYIPGGPKTVLMKTQFLKKTCVSPQRGNNLYPWKSVKFGRPNLCLFLGNCVFTSVKHHFVIHFDRASITLLSFHFICRNISTVFSSSFLYLFTKRHCHILAYNITSLCLAPKEFGMIFCSWSMQHQ